MAKNENEAMLETLLCYKAMALDHSKHDEMLKDKTVLQFLAYSLDSDDSEIIEASLKTIELLTHNNKNYSKLKSTFGVVEALKVTCEREGLEDNLKYLAKELCMKLEDGPAYCTRSRTAGKNINSEHSSLAATRKLSTKVYSFHVFGLNEETRKSIELAVIRIRGVISVIIDPGHQRCVVRTVESIAPQQLIDHIAKETKLEARLILRNKLRQEVLVELEKNESAGVDDLIIEDNLPEYLPEEESPVKEKALYSFDRLRTSAASWVRSATSLFQSSFYW
ncbi:hypothetical protein O3M35_002378 [Rhynocoris fuscipes]|uniref:Armadillo repeat-containing protein 1 n=1 Tax=Rhynocoris fuscipes TaxID=488301 RepID=A0AAW1CMM9_9HEMI